MAKMGRPQKDPGEVRKSVTASLVPDIVAELEAIAFSQDRSRSYVVEKLILRGLAAYERDGLLSEEALTKADMIRAKVLDVELGANDAQPAATRKAKKIA